MNLLKKAAILIFTVLIANVFSVPIKENSPVIESTGLSQLATEQNTIRNTGCWDDKQNHKNLWIK